METLAGPNTAEASTFEVKTYRRNLGKLNPGSYRSYQDTKGYQWFSGFQGVQRFDGNELVNIYPTDELGRLPRDHVKSMIEAHGAMWFGTQGGVGKLDLTSYETTLYKNFADNSPKQIFITELSTDSQGRLWASTKNGVNLYQSDTDSFKHYSLPFEFGDKDASLHSVVSLDTQRVWVVSSNYGLLALNINTGTFTKAETLIQTSELNQDILNSQSITSAITTKAGTTIISSGDSLYELKGLELVYYTKLVTDSNNKANNKLLQLIVEDHFGDLWISSNSNQLFKVSHDRKSTFLSMPITEAGEPVDSTYSISIDNTGHIMLGFYDNEPRFINPKQQRIRMIPIPDADTSHVATINKGLGDVLWLTNLDNVFRYNTTNDTVRSYPFNLKYKASLLSSVQLEDGRVLVSSYKGLYELDQDSGNYRQLLKSTIFSLQYSPRWGVWFRAYNNYFHYDISSGKTTKYKFDGFSSLQTSKLYLDERYGPMFVLRDKLYQYNKNSDSFEASSFPNSSFIEMDSYLFRINKQLYLAGRGLTTADISAKDSKIQLSNIRIEDKFSAESLSRPQVDNDGGVWLNSSRADALFYFKPSTDTYIKTSISEGFPAERFSAYAFLSKPNQLVAAVRNKIWRLDNPFDLIASRESKLDISSVDILSDGGQRQTLLNNLETVELTHRTNAIIFRFSQNLGQVGNYQKLQVRLWGYNNEWLDAPDNHIIYSSLGAGSYTFEVKDKTTQKSKEIQILIKPAPWFSGWAYFIYTLAFAAIVSIYFRRRLKKFLKNRRNADKTRLYAQSFESASEGFCISTINGELLAHNKAFASLLGLNSDVQNLQGVDLRSYLSQTNTRKVLLDMNKSLSKEGSWAGQLWIKAANAEEIPVHCKAQRVVQKSRPDDCYILVLSDMTEQLEKEETLKRLASFDTLTGLPNRRLLNDRINRSINSIGRANSGEGLAIILLNIDRFKSINETLGHDYGDSILTNVAQKFKSCLREVDTIARLSGDEFAILIENVEHIENVAKVCQKLISTTESPLHIEQKEIYIPFSIGIAIYPADGKDIKDLMKHADTAMYNAKQRGGNNFAFYTQTMNERSLNALRLEAEIRQGIRNQEFLPYLQPKISMEDGSIIGAEALIRWRKPKEGLVPPISFIEAAEHTGLIAPLGAIVIHETCRYLSQWKASGGLLVPIAVNVSAKQLLLENFIDVVDDTIAKFGVDPALLEFEITESTVMQDMGAAIKKLHQLRERGHTISVDDFGTGYSSLSYIADLPIDTLKIDQSFVRDMLTDKGKYNIVKTIIELARNLDLKTVAEGIETEDIHQALCALGVDYGQGYLYGRPQSVEDFMESSLFQSKSFISENEA